MHARIYEEYVLLQFHLSHLILEGEFNGGEFARDDSNFFYRIISSNVPQPPASPQS